MENTRKVLLVVIWCYYDFIGASTDAVTPEMYYNSAMKQMQQQAMSAIEKQMQNQFAAAWKNANGGGGGGMVGMGGMAGMNGMGNMGRVQGMKSDARNAGK